MTNGPLFKFSRPVRGTRGEGEGERVDAFPAISTQDFRPTTEFRSVFLILSLPPSPSHSLFLSLSLSLSLSFHPRWRIDGYRREWKCFHRAFRAFINRIRLIDRIDGIMRMIQRCSLNRDACTRCVWVI